MMGEQGRNQYRPSPFHTQRILPTVSLKMFFISSPLNGQWQYTDPWLFDKNI